MHRSLLATSIEWLPSDLLKTCPRSDTQPRARTRPPEPTKAADAGGTDNPEFRAVRTKALHCPRLPQAFQIQMIVSTNSAIHTGRQPQTTTTSNPLRTSQPRIQAPEATAETHLFVQWVVQGLTSSVVARSRLRALHRTRLPSRSEEHTSELQS